MYDNFRYRLAPMASECKSARISARLPASLVARADYVARNNDGAIKNRSGALQAALETWLPGQEKRLEELGVLIPKKAR